jgi:hypothetical protein
MIHCFVQIHRHHHRLAPLVRPEPLELQLSVLLHLPVPEVVL